MGRSVTVKSQGARRFGLAFVLLALTGCHADITERLDFRTDGGGTISLREAADDQFYQIARSQSADPFGIEQAKKNGWDVDQTLADNGDHVLTLRRPFSSGEANAALHSTVVGQQTALGAVDIQQRGNLFSTTVRLHATIPRLLPVQRSASPWASVGANAIAAIIGIHFVISAPGHIDDTNGERASDGSVHWDVSLTEPTTIAMTVTYADPIKIAAAAALLVVVLAAAVLAYLRMVRVPVREHA